MHELGQVFWWSAFLVRVTEKHRTDGSLLLCADARPIVNTKPLISRSIKYIDEWQRMRGLIVRISRGLVNILEGNIQNMYNRRELQSFISTDTASLKKHMEDQMCVLLRFVLVALYRKTLSIQSILVHPILACHQ